MKPDSADEFMIEWMAAGSPPAAVMGRPVHYVFALERWYYVGENGQFDGPVEEPGERPRHACAFCGDRATVEGHDPCLGTLEGVKAACCGHGARCYAYVLFEDGRCVRYGAALDLFALLGVGPVAKAVAA